MNSIYSPYDGKKCVKAFELTEGEDKILYESLINDPGVTVIKEEFTYAGREHNIPIVTVWYIEE